MSAGRRHDGPPLESRERVAAGADRRRATPRPLAAERTSATVQNRSVVVVVETSLSVGEHVRAGAGGGRRRRGSCDARERRDDRGVDALAAHVADRDDPVVRADLEDVVEVAADLVAVAGRPVGARRRRGRGWSAGPAG